MVYCSLAGPRGSDSRDHGAQRCRRSEAGNKLFFFLYIQITLLQRNTRGRFTSPVKIYHISNFKEAVSLRAVVSVLEDDIDLASVMLALNFDGNEWIVVSKRWRWSYKC